MWTSDFLWRKIDSLMQNSLMLRLDCTLNKSGQTARILQVLTSSKIIFKSGYDYEFNY